MVVVAMVVMSVGSERRAGKRHQDQEERGCKNPFHGSNVARLAATGKTSAYSESKEETCARACGDEAGRVVESVGLSGSSKE